MPPGDLQPLDASGLINLEPPQQPVIMVNNTVSVASSAAGNKKKRSSAAASQSNAAAANKTTVSGNQNGATASEAAVDNKPVSASKKRKTKKPFEELRRPSAVHNNSGSGDLYPQNGDQTAAPDSSAPGGGASNQIKQLGEMHDNDADMPDQVDGNGVGGIAENWSDQQTIKVKVCIPTLSFL